MKNLPVVLVTGLSGAGKSTVVSIFEDMGFLPLIGIPVTLIPATVTTLLPTLPKNIQGIVVGISPSEARTELLQYIRSVKQQLQDTPGVIPFLAFIDASHAVLFQRYAQTRRPHPHETPNLTLEEAIQQEFALRDLRSYADIVIDTSTHTVHTLRSFLEEEWADMFAHTSQMLAVHLVAFGFKYGIPYDLDTMFDVRFLPNPYFVPELRPLDGLSDAIQEYVFAHKEAQKVYTAILSYVGEVLQLYKNAHWRRLTLGIGCTGGKHRSVAFVAKLQQDLATHGVTCNVDYRNISSAK